MRELFDKIRISLHDKTVNGIVLIEDLDSSNTILNLYKDIYHRWRDHVLYVTDIPASMNANTFKNLSKNAPCENILCIDLKNNINEYHELIAQLEDCLDVPIVVRYVTANDEEIPASLSYISKFICKISQDDTYQILKSINL